MANHRLPLGKAKLTGAAAKNPQRYRDAADPVSSGPVGDAPDCLNAAQKKAWNDFRLRWSWLTADDEVALIGLCQMRADIEDRGVEKNAAMYTAYRLMLSEFGGTPVSRSKIFQPKDDKADDPFADFAN
jgi:hypothetical protein